MDIKKSIWSMMAVVMALLVITGCKATQESEDGEKEMMKAAVPASPFNKPGFYGVRDDGRLWVFRAGSEDLEEFLAVGEPAKSVTLIGRGPNGMTIRGTDKESIYAYMYNKPGFEVFYEDGRLWVFKSGSKGLEEYLTHGEPGKNATIIGKGPKGMTVRSSDMKTIYDYLLYKEGYYTEVVDGRLWVFKEGSESLEEYLTHGEPGKNATVVGKGPWNMTVRSDSMKTIYNYLYGKKGYVVDYVEGRIWVFKAGSEGLEEYMTTGEPGKNATVIGKGPEGKTVRSDSLSTIYSYLYGKDGFEVDIHEGRMWVFMEGSKAYEQYSTVGEPAKSITLIGKGPNGMTIRGADREVIEAYLASN